MPALRSDVQARRWAEIFRLSFSALHGNVTSVKKCIRLYGLPSDAAPEPVGDLMRAHSKRPVPLYVWLGAFFRSLGIYHKLAKHLIELGILTPDAYSNNMPIFLADIDGSRKPRLPCTNSDHAKIGLTKIDQHRALELLGERCAREETPQARMHRPIGPQSVPVVPHPNRFAPVGLTGVRRRQLRLGLLYLFASVAEDISFSLAGWIVLLFASKVGKRKSKRT